MPVDFAVLPTRKTGPAGPWVRRTKRLPVIVTISREYGAAGLAVAHGTARELGYELLTDDLPRTVAARLGTTAAEVGARGSAPLPLSERLLAGLGAGTAELISAAPPRHDPGDFEESVRREIERTIRERSARGSVVILGRMASAVLAGTPALLRVFLTAPRAWRVERIVETFGLTRGDAEREVDAIDPLRRRFAKERYRIAWGDPHFYDMILDTSRFGIDGSVAVVVAAVRACAPG